MKRLSRIVRVTISLFAFAAWLSAVNHCAFGDSVSAGRPTAAPSHANCPGHQDPSGKSGDQDSDVGCCKAFPDASLALTKTLPAYSTDFSAIHFAFCTAIISPAHSQLDLRPLELDTGPPFARSLVEFILQRSLQAHAPPSSV